MSLMTQIEEELYAWRDRAETAEKLAAGLEINLAAVIERAEKSEAERDESSSQIRRLLDCPGCEDHEALVEQLAEARKDSERLTALEVEWAKEGNCPVMECDGKFFAPESKVRTGGSLRAAIDAAKEGK